MSEFQLTKIFKAIADPVRREIFHMLVLTTVALPINHISEKFDISRQGLTKHIKLLEGAGLVDIEKHGREQLCKANLEPLRDISSWIRVYDKFWNDKLESLDRFLDKKK